MMRHSHQQDRNRASTKDISSEQRITYQMGCYLLAFAFLMNGLAGLVQSTIAKHDFQRCQYVMFERLFGGTDLNPTRDTLEQSFVYFAFVYHIQKLLMIAFSIMLVQN